MERRSDRVRWQGLISSLVTRQFQNTPRCLVFGVPNAWLNGSKRKGGARLRTTHLVDENTTSFLFWGPLCLFVLISIVFFHRTRNYGPRLAHRLVARNLGPVVISRKNSGSNGLGDKLLLSRQCLCTDLSFLCPVGRSFCGTVFDTSFRF